VIDFEFATLLEDDGSGLPLTLKPTLAR
jgi:hypothetical protein